jgi:hypothetical protein
MLLMAAACVACGGIDKNPTVTPACLTALPSDCTPDISPTYAEIYTKVIAQRCGATDSGTACHGKNGLHGDLGLFNADAAYDALLGIGAKHARVQPDDPKCSLLMQRLESTDPKFRMPLGEAALSPGLRCAIQLWIEAGAEK